MGTALKGDSTRILDGSATSKAKKSFYSTWDLCLALVQYYIMNVALQIRRYWSLQLYAIKTIVLETDLPPDYSNARLDSIKQEKLNLIHLRQIALQSYLTRLIEKINFGERTCC